MNDSRIIYKINKEKRVIVCIITGCEEIARRRINKYAPHIDTWWGFDNCEIKNSYTGIARCLPDDEWDEEKGKKLALIRAKRERSRDINRIVYNVTQVIKREIDDLEKNGVHKLPNENEILS